MSLNEKLMNMYSAETGDDATYKKGSSVYHTLKYVDWLEEIASKNLEAAKQPTANIRVKKLLGDLKHHISVGKLEIKCNDYYFREIDAVLVQLLNT